jgi:sugar lactone lactonase YvrE
VFTWQRSKTIKLSSLSRCALGISAAIALLSGCGGSQLPASAPGASTVGVLNLRTGHFVTPILQTGARVPDSPNFKLSNSLLYVVNFDAAGYELGDVAIYDAKVNDPSPKAIIAKGLDGPGGDCIDHTGTLYVASQAGWVTEYAPGRTKPLRYIRKGLGTPIDCSIDASGNLWVANLSSVVEYLEGSSRPHTVITDGVCYANSVVFDHAGNMYVGNLGALYSCPFNIQVYAPGSKSPSRTITDGITWPVGTAVDTNDTLYVANTETCNVEEYRFGQSHPFQAITDEVATPFGLTLDANGRLYESNWGDNSTCGNGPSSTVLEFPHGSLKPAKRTISTLTYPSGLAFYPPQLP